jgi:hypothetical protein
VRAVNEFEDGSGKLAAAGRDVDRVIAREDV